MSKYLFPFRWPQFRSTVLRLGLVLSPGLCHRHVHIRAGGGEGVPSVLPVPGHDHVRILLLPLWGGQDSGHPLDLVLYIRPDHGRYLPDYRVARSGVRGGQMVREGKARPDLWHLEQSHVHWKCSGDIAPRLLRDV